MISAAVSCTAFAPIGALVVGGRPPAWPPGVAFRGGALAHCDGWDSFADAPTAGGNDRAEVQVPSADRGPRRRRHHGPRFRGFPPDRGFSRDRSDPGPHRVCPGRVERHSRVSRKTLPKVGRDEVKTASEPYNRVHRRSGHPGVAIPVQTRRPFVESGGKRGEGNAGFHHPSRSHADLSFFFLLSRSRPADKLAENLPFLEPAVRTDAVFLVREFVSIVVSFFCGQLVIGLVMGVLYAVGFSFV